MAPFGKKKHRATRYMKMNKIFFWLDPPYTLNDHWKSVIQQLNLPCFIKMSVDEFVLSPYHPENMLTR